METVSKNIRISNFTTIHPVAADLFHADTNKTDMAKLTVFFFASLQTCLERSRGHA